MKAFVSVALLATLVAVAGTAAAAQGPLRVRTTVTVSGKLWSFAQNDRYFAWSSSSPGERTCLTFMQVHTGVRTPVRGNCETGLMLLAGDRAYWEAQGASNLTEYSSLMTASPRTRKVESLGFQSIYNLGFDHLVPPASDGRSVYFWTSPADSTPGPIYRFDGSRSRRMTPTVRSLNALGAGEGRWAFAQTKRTYDCAQEPTWYPARANRFRERRRTQLSGRHLGREPQRRGARRLAESGRNPDWSPGSDLAYDDHGSVKVLSGATQPRVLIARGTNPSWDPNGTRIAFERDGAIVVADGHGGSERILVAGAADPDWSRDGTQIVFARTDKGNLGLGIVGVDGSGLRTLTTGDDRDPSWSPNGQRIAYAHCSGLHAGCPDDVTQIFEVAPDGSGKGVRTEDSDETFDSAPAWAPDSRRLVFARSRDWQDAGDSHIFLGDRALTRTPPPVTPVIVRTRSGRTIRRLTPSGEAVELAVTRRLTAALVKAGTWRLDVFAPKRRTVTFPRSPRVSGLSASGSRLVLRVGRKIVLYDIRARRLQVIAQPAYPTIGLSIVGRRVAWAENVGRKARVRAITLPR